MTRYAVYYAPPAGHPLWRAGCDWLGRDPRQGQPLTSPTQAHRISPWRYGFHATLKPPCRIAVDESEWLRAVQSLAQRHTRFALPPLQVAMLSDFLALQAVQPLDAAHPLRRLADDCVLALDPLRTPLSDAERARYLQPGFSERQRRHVECFGYAHVLDDWRFHMTLTDSLSGIDPGTATTLRLQAEGHFAAALREPLPCDTLCVFIEPARGEPFRLAHRFPLAEA